MLGFRKERGGREREQGEEGNGEPHGSRVEKRKVIISWAYELCLEVLRIEE